MTIAKQSQSAIWVPVNGKFAAVTPFQRGQSGATGITLPGAGDKTLIYGTDPYGNPVPLTSERGTPGQPSITIQNYITFGRDAIQKAQITGKSDYVQVRIHDCVSLDNASGWDVLLHFGNTRAGDATIGDPASREFADGRIEQDVPFTPDYVILWFAQSLTALTTSETADANDVWFLSEPDSLADCGNGYPGADKIGYIACDAASSATANILYTNDGGGTLAATSADPFAADEHVDHVVAILRSKTQMRVVVCRVTTDGSNPAEVAYADISMGDEGTTTWTTSNVGSTNGETITAAFWPKLNRLYVATSGADIYLSTDQGASFTAIATDIGGNVNAFTSGPDGNVYACGTAGILFVEKGDSGTFSALTDPTGSDASTAIAVTREGIWLGNGTSIFYSRNLSPASANDWTSSKDFGANHQVQAISPKGGVRAFGGDSQLLHVVVSDTTGNEGDVWLTADGGGFWQETTNLTNSGYNGAYFSPVDDNLGFIVGDDNGSTAVIHKLSVNTGV